MNYRISLVTLLGAAALFFTSVSAGAPPPIPHFPFLPPPSVSVVGAPGNGLIPFAPKSFTVAQLAAMTQTTDTVTVGGSSTTESGPLLSLVLASAGFTTIAACSNDELRYWASATGTDGSSAEITAGELDKSFGNRQAILSLTENGTPLQRPRLVVPNDATDARDISGITNVTVGRAAPQLASTTSACNPANFTPPVTAPPTGTVTFNGDIEHPVSLNYDQLGAMPQVTQTDTFLQGTKTKVDTESGPTLFSLLAATEPRFQFCRANDDLNWYAEVTSSEDGFAVVVSWAEIDPLLDGTQSLLSLLENNQPTDQPTPVGTGDPDPRLTMPGDVKGGRYNFGAAVITLFRAPSAGLPRPACLLEGLANQGSN